MYYKKKKKQYQKKNEKKKSQMSSTYRVTIISYREEKSLVFALFPCLIPFGFIGLHRIYLNDHLSSVWQLYSMFTACGFGFLMIWLLAFDGSFDSTATLMFLCSMFFFVLLGILLLVDIIQLPSKIDRHNRTIKNNSFFK